MTYATQQNMIDRFGLIELTDLTDLSGNGVIDANVLGMALADANNEIDGYLSSTISLPLLTIPPRLVKLACDISRYNLYGAKCSDQVRNRYTDAISFLKQVVIGTASLGLDATNNPAPDLGGIRMNSVTPAFSQSTLGDYTNPGYPV
jgi:phage gp36-like protein